jgi:hypothetical protein
MIRHAVGISIASASVAVFVPVAANIVGGLGSAGRRTLVLLLLETAYLLVSAMLAGVMLSPRRDSLLAASVPVLIAVFGSFVVAWIAGDTRAWAAAQPAALAAAVLSWGIGVFFGTCNRRVGLATILALASLASLTIGLSWVSDVAPLLARRPSLAAWLLALNPFVAVASSGGFDLVRSEGLYAVLALPGYRFEYPSPWQCVITPAVLGIVLSGGIARVRSRGAWLAGERKLDMRSS